MANPLLFSIRQAERDNRKLKSLFGRSIGSKAKPRGAILSAYRQGRRQIAQLLKGNASDIEVSNALSDFSLNVSVIIDDAVRQAIELGKASSVAQLAAYADEGVSFLASRQSPNLQLFTASPRAAIERQMAVIRGLIASNASIEEIVGDDVRLGVMQPAPVQRDTANFTAIAAAAGFSYWLNGSQPETRPQSVFMKQAIAGIDERTTDCCLRVHGQVQPIDKPFELRGTPRYADKVQNPPFHNYCRTSTALYMEQWDDGLTEQMRQAARLETEARDKANYKAPHPANAFTRVRR